jgi:predicted nucleic acid-binding protein
VTRARLRLSQIQVCLPPVVLTELLSDPKLGRDVAEVLLQIPLLGIATGFWERAGRLRSGILAKGGRARLADTLIAQACLDDEVPLITRDADFRRFEAAGLQLLP